MDIKITHNMIQYKNVENRKEGLHKKRRRNVSAK